jgi:UDP-glucose 4-epimerase
VHVLITGGAGFIGHHLVKKLLFTGESQIVIIDNLCARKNNNLLKRTIKNSPPKSISFYKEDILNKQYCIRYFQT